MASSFSKVVAALIGALIFSLLVTYGSCATPANFTASDFTADPNWEAARATWYGAPTGAGPDDNGTYHPVGGDVVVARRRIVVYCISMTACVLCCWLNARWSPLY